MIFKMLKTWNKSVLPSKERTEATRPPLIHKTHHPCTPTLEAAAMIIPGILQTPVLLLPALVEVLGHLAEMDQKHQSTCPSGSIQVVLTGTGKPPRPTLNPLLTQSLKRLACQLVKLLES